MNLIVLNTIGLTGVEALHARMNSIRNVLTLPGQNFAMFNQGLYRPHDYHGKTDDEIFNILNAKHCILQRLFVQFAKKSLFLRP